MQALNVIGIMWAALAVGTLQALAVIVGTVVLSMKLTSAWMRHLARDRSMGHLYYCEKCRKVSRRTR